jgi:hypothetical protein
MSAIRNTNTKIILRLPDQGDRELVGKAAGLNNDQITELAKLQLGIAAVYQNDWLQPVLCKVDHFATPEKMYSYTKPKQDKTGGNNDADELKKKLISFIFTADEDVNVDNLKADLLKAPFETWLKVRIYDYLTAHTPPSVESPYVEGNFISFSDIFAGLYNSKCKAIEKYSPGASYEAWAASFYHELDPHINFFSEDIQQIIRDSIIIESVKANKDMLELQEQWFKPEHKGE